MLLRLLLFLILLAAIKITVKPEFLPDMGSVSAVLVMAYVLGRGKYYRLAAAMTIFALSAPAYARILITRSIDAYTFNITLMWIALPVLVSGLLLSVRGVIITVVINIGVLLLLPVLLPELGFESVALPLSFIGTTSALVTFATALRRQDRAQIEVHSRELEASEERYRRLLELSPVAIGVHIDGKIVYTNAACVELLGATSADQLTGKSILELVHPDYRESVAERIRRGSEGGAAIGPFEEKMIRLDDEVIDIEVTTNPTTYLDQQATQVVMRDITERRRAESELRHLKVFHEDIVQNMFEGIVVQDVEGNFTFVNPAAANMLGYTSEELLGLQWTIAVPTDWHAVIQAADERRIRGESDQYEIEALNKEGNRLPILISGSPRFEDGDFAGTLAVFTDITKLKRAEEALRENEEKYRTIIESIEDGYFEVDQAGNFTFFNNALLEISGYSSDELMGMNYQEYTDEETAERVFKTFNEIYKTGKPARVFNLTVIRKDGSQSHVEVSVSPIWDAQEQVTGFRGIVRDVTERKLAEEALYAAYETLQEADRLKDEMIQNISHEFRTPLTYVLSYVDLLLGESPGMGKLGEEQRESLTVIDNQAQRLRRLLDNFVTIQDIEEYGLVRERVEIDKLLVEVKEDAQTMATEAGIKLAVHIDTDLPAVLVNPATIIQVIDNLVLNALKFTPAGGEVVIRAWSKNEKVYVSVEDTGIGIPKEALNRIFDRFVQVDGTTRRRFGGLGLGLAICKKVIEQHEEKIWVESTLGKGSTFTFTLPVAK